MTAHVPNSVEARDMKSFLHGFSHLGTLEEDGPHIISRGEGIYVEDIHGRRFLEGNSGLWNIVAGFDNKDLIEAGCDQLRRLGAYHAFFGRNSEPAVALAERLLEIAPVPMSKVFFANSGSEANDTAVKILWMINHGRGRPERRKIISRELAYHGVTTLTASLTGKDYNRVFGLPIADILFTDCPHHWRDAEAGESEEDYSRRLAGNLERLVQIEDPSTIAGFIAEPVMGAGGVIPPPAGYFAAIQSVLRKYDIPLIADEVVCGLGRTGQLWGSTTYGIKPDIIVTSKCLTAGYFPLSAVIISQEIEAGLIEAATEVEEFPHGFTTGAHPVGCAIALKAVELITEGGLFDNVVKVAPHFQSRLRALSDHPMIGEARGIGLMGALEIVADKIRKTPFPAELDITERIARRALEHGLIIRPLAQAVIFAPPFVITREEIDALFDRVTLTLDDIQSEFASRSAASIA
ncbi:MAG: aminotransferase class III-fold pyridoxal phosphate-dependent enzyme [Alphaproteobacteria bacterium]|nr:aminotransferase class III-fold pyridoxal phosphate-dependent enzyme [Alphaproteobacteria bacterium]